MVLKRKVCDICKYHVCSVEEYNNASPSERANYSSKWCHHLNSKQHLLAEYDIQRRKEHYCDVEDKENVIKNLKHDIIRMCNTEMRGLFPHKILDIHFEYCNRETEEYCAPILKENGFIVPK